MAKPPRAAKSFNKIAVRLAGRRVIPLWVRLVHRGRRSGRPYTIPVAVIPGDTTFVIALPWGRETDWVRNVRAAGGCTIRWKGVDYDCTDPTFVGQDVAIASSRGLLRAILRRGSFPGGFLQLTRRRTADPMM